MMNPASTATLEETLIHEHMENGIQKILAKLDVVMVENFSNIKMQRGWCAARQAGNERKFLCCPVCAGQYFYSLITVHEIQMVLIHQGIFETIKRAYLICTFS